MRFTTVFLCLFAGISLASAQDAVPDNAGFESKTALAERLEHMKKHAQSFKGTRESQSAKQGGQIKAIEKPLLRWNNRFSNIKDGILAAWVAESGRPMAMAQICLIPNSETQWCIEMQSLTTEKFELDAEFNGPWRPRAPGVKWKSLGKPAEVPARTEALRLVQMRNHARRFRCDDNFEFKGNDLRLLTTPLIRYKEPDAGVLDGGMFAMVHDTDPELIILVELRAASDEQPAGYYYALAPMTAFELKVLLDGKQVWHKPLMSSNLDTDIFWQRQLAESATPRQRGLLRRLFGL